MDITIDERAAATFAVPADVPHDVEMILINLVGKLLAFSPEHGDTCDDLNGEVTVLLDAEVDGVRLLALRRENPSPISLLSPREQEIARMVASGYPNKTIASVLEISSWTMDRGLPPAPDLYETQSIISCSHGCTPDGIGSE